MALKILSVVETRPGIIKAAAICEAIRQFNGIVSGRSIQHVLVHTGYSYENRGVDLYFNDLNPPNPDLFLRVPADANSFERTAKIMESFAYVIQKEQPTVVLVTGDRDSALDCALVTKRTGWRADRGATESLAPALAHIEAGFRSHDHAAPQEVNRIVVDSLSDYLFTSEETASRNLLEEGVSRDNIRLVGSITIDTLLRNLPRALKSSILSDLQLSGSSGVKPFALLTLQHLSAAAHDGKLPALQRALSDISRRMPVIFPASPVALKRIHEADLADNFIDHFLDGPEAWDARVRIRLIPPLGYLDFIRLMGAARVVLTDSSGVQEESRVLGVPCITLSDDASRPVTLKNGANVLAGTDPGRVMDAFFRATQGMFSPQEPPMGWDGRAAQRIIETLWTEFSGGEPLKNPRSAGRRRMAVRATM